MVKFELEEYHRNISKDEFIADLKRVALKLKKNALTHKDYNKYGRFNSSTLRRKFGSWFSALTEAGLEKTRNLNLTKDELVSDLKGVANKLKKNSITIEDYRKFGSFGASTIQSKFGSWFKALEIADLQKTRNFGITEEEYFKNLEEVWVKLGRQPHYNDMHKPLSKYVGSAYEYKFGTWRKSLEKFITYINKEEILNINEGQPSIIVDNHDIIEETIIRHKTRREISWRLRFIVMRRDNFKCKCCGRSPATDSKIILHVDHVIPYSNGGETVLENLQTLCSVCNIGKSNLET